MYYEDLELGAEIDIEPVVIDKQKMIDFAKLLEKMDKSICKIVISMVYCMGNWKRIQICTITGENDHLKD